MPLKTFRKEVYRLHQTVRGVHCTQGQDPRLHPAFWGLDFWSVPVGLGANQSRFGRTGSLFSFRKPLMVRSEMLPTSGWKIELGDCLQHRPQHSRLGMLLVSWYLCLKLENKGNRWFYPCLQVQAHHLKISSLVSVLLPFSLSFRVSKLPLALGR